MLAENGLLNDGVRAMGQALGAQVLPMEGGMLEKQLWRKLAACGF